ncbi:nuclear transport factor 2 family protein [Dokdonella sp.]|uniref:YybH family protein n=1 Tax=Dokdonella sp. TaxID=2291710 RepID=UPI001B2B0F32|nr:nuclear transport factor 2 family protein [Dokdonella sp.]MBO9662255.1 nuclear transport factor 2 family protein [Dokdonella sp.]
MNQTADPFRRALAAYAAAARAKDIEAFLALYDEEVVLFDLWGSWSLRGIETWRTAVTDWFGSLGDQLLVVTADDVESRVDGDLAVGHAILTYAAFSADGRALRSLDNRITMVLKRCGDAWRIVHEHTSAPVDHATSKAVLKRGSIS